MMSLRPRKIINIKPSKYESAEAIHSYKKYWKNVFDVLDKGCTESISFLYKQGDRPDVPNAGTVTLLGTDFKSQLVPFWYKTAALSDDCIKLFSQYIDEFKNDDEIKHLQQNSWQPTPKPSNVFMGGGVTWYQISQGEIEILSEALPEDLFDKVCGILDIDVPKKDPDTDIKTKEIRRRITKHPLLSKRKVFTVHRELDSDTDVEISSTLEDDGLNIHQEFLRKPVREQITWPTRYLQPEQEHEKTLVKKADDLTDRIANRFCDYMKELGGDQQSQLFTPKTIKELFQIEFDTHAARSLKVVPVELPSINERVASVTGNKEKSRYAALDREISKDIKAERQANYVKCFERSIPRRDQWYTPLNDTKNQWKSARHVPKDLVTLKTVWEGITNLRSVKEYCRWMIEHPEYRRAPYLSSLGMFDRAVLNARLTVELKDPNPHINAPAPIEHIRKRLSDLMEPN